MQCNPSGQESHLSIASPELLLRVGDTPLLPSSPCRRTLFEGGVSDPAPDDSDPGISARPSQDTHAQTGLPDRSSTACAHATRRGQNCSETRFQPPSKSHYLDPDIKRGEVPVFWGGSVSESKCVDQLLSLRRQTSPGCSHG